MYKETLLLYKAITELRLLQIILPRNLTKNCRMHPNIFPKPPKSKFCLDSLNNRIFFLTTTKLTISALIYFNCVFKRLHGISKKRKHVLSWYLYLDCMQWIIYIYCQIYLDKNVTNVWINCFYLWNKLWRNKCIFCFIVVSPTARFVRDIYYS